MSSDIKFKKIELIPQEKLPNIVYGNTMLKPIVIPKLLLCTLSLEQITRKLALIK